MSYPNQSHTSDPYLQAPQDLFRRPVFWASAVGLLLVVLGAWKYWNDPHWFNAFLGNQANKSEQSNKQALNPALSSEKPAAISTDPNMPSALGKGLDQSTGLPPLNLPNQTAPLPYPPGLLPFPSQAGAISRPTQKMLSANNPLATSSLSTNLSTNPFAGSSRFTAFQSPGKLPSPVRTATGSAVNANSLNSTNKNPRLIATSALPNPLNQEPVLNSPSRTNPTQRTVNSQKRVIPTLYSQGQLPFIPGAMDSNPSVGQFPSASAPLPTVIGYTPSVGQLPSVPVPAPGVTSDKVSLTTPTPLSSNNSLTQAPPSANVPTAVRVTPIVAVRPSNFGQYSTQLPNQTNEVINPGFDSMLENPGLQASQANLPTFTTPHTISGGEIWGQANTSAK